MSVGPPPVKVVVVTGVPVGLGVVFVVPVMIWAQTLPVLVSCTVAPELVTATALGNWATRPLPNRYWPNITRLPSGGTLMRGSGLGTAVNPPAIRPVPGPGRMSKRI